jgi:hypothetical protein
VERFKQLIPARQRSAFVAGLLERALPEEDDPLYHIALEVEQDAALTAEMREWREALVGDGIRGAEYAGREPDASR